eukprot:1141821-Pelagomonas_calceolata.AAC.4
MYTGVHLRDCYPHRLPGHAMAGSVYSGGNMLALMWFESELVRTLNSSAAAPKQCPATFCFSLKSCASERTACNAPACWQLQQTPAACAWFLKGAIGAQSQPPAVRSSQPIAVRSSQPFAFRSAQPLQPGQIAEAAMSLPTAAGLFEWKRTEASPRSKNAPLGCG